MLYKMALHNILRNKRDSEAHLSFYALNRRRHTPKYILLCL